jgi:Transmembrane secretion effector
MGEASATDGYRAALARPDFRRLFVAGLASSSGGAVTAVCILWIVFTSTRSPVDVGLVGTAELAAAIVFSLIGGTLVDRYDRRSLMVGSDLIRAAAVGGLAVFLEFRGFDLLTVLLASFVVGAFTTIFNPAQQTVVPAVVGPEHIADANGLIRSTQAGTMLAGSSAGGLLIVSVGPVVGLGYNAGTFVVSGVLIAMMGLSAEARHPERTGPARSFFGDVWEGFRWLRGAVGLLQLTISAGFFNFFSTLVGAFLVVYATLALHGSGVVFGILLAVQVGAQGVGSLVVGRIGATRWAGRAWVVFYGALSPLTAIGLALDPSPLPAIGMMAAMGFCGGLAGTAWLSAAQLTVPAEMQGRYFGVDGLGSWAILPVAQIGGGFLIAALGFTTTYLLAGILWLAIGLAFLVPSALARWGYPPRETDARSPTDHSGTA